MFSSQARLQRGNLLLKQGNLDEAESDFKRVVSVWRHEGQSVSTLLYRLRVSLNEAPKLTRRCHCWTVGMFDVGNSVSCVGISNESGSQRECSGFVKADYV